MNKIAPRASWWILCLLGVGAIFSMFYWGTRSDEVEAAHHEEVKSLVKESIAKQEVTAVKVEKLDKKVEKFNYELHAGHAKYLKDVAQLNKSIKNNQASYDKAYALMDTTDIAAVNSFNAKWLSKADSLTEW